MSQDQQFLTVRIKRGDAENSKFVEYQVPELASQTILDVVTWIQRNLDSSLSYRFACRVGMCGSCAMTVNGKPRWTCRTHVNKVCDSNIVTIEPLRNFKVVKDLACDMTRFFDKWVKADAVFKPSQDRNDGIQVIKPKQKQRREANAGIECINCGVCYSACDVVDSNVDYLGPAALNRAWTLINDVRDAGNKERLKAVSAVGGCQNCHTQQGCASHCPATLNPTRSIAGLKKSAMMASLKGEL